MPAKTGVGVLLQIENSGSPGTYRTLGGQRNATLTRGTSTADSTNKTTAAGWEENLPTFKNWSIECDGILLSDDLAYGDLLTAWRNGTQINVRINDTVTAGTETGLATITEIGEESPHDDVRTCSLSLQGSGALTAA